jgi:hypothetical protein
MNYELEQTAEMPSLLVFFLTMHRYQLIRKIMPVHPSRKYLKDTTVVY